MYLLSQPILSCRDAVEAEKRFLEEDSFKVTAAMEAAGSGMARAILRDWQELGEFPAWARILVLAGKGHNAGDALIAANYILAQRPHALLSVLWVEGSDSLKEATAEAAQICRQTGQMEEFTVNPQSLRELAAREWDLVIDGILGMTFNPPLRPHTEEVLRWANEELAPKAAFRAAVDLPSGWGDLKGSRVFTADFTYMTGLAKAPAFEPEAISYTGRVRLVRIPLFQLDEDAAHAMVLPTAHREMNRLRAPDSDKRSYGHVLILAGSLHMPGAAIMATLGAIHAGSGLVTTFSPANVAPRVASAVPEAMWQPVPVNPDGSLEVETLRALHTASESGRALLIGPGLKMDRPTQFIISRAIREIVLPLVMDASALTAESMAAVLSRPMHAGPVVITPHLGEYRRITAQAEAEYDIEAARAFCRKYRLTMVLKGPITRICDGDRVLEAPAGGPILARGGSGDFLAGMLVTGLAQNPDAPIEVAARAVSWHGAAADWLARRSGSVAVRTTDLLAGLAPALRESIYE